jgi:predicted nucleotide-binding protein
MTHDEILRELRELSAQRDGLDTDAGRRWLGRVTALVELVDLPRADAIKQQTPVFGMPVSVGMRGAAWAQVLQNLQDVIAKLEIGGYPAARTPDRGQGSTGNRVFIGHGRSSEWLKLMKFLTERLGLDYEEFNREPAAGYSNKERLEAMLESSGFGFLVMTAEDVDSEGQLHARENVVHEAGLFQGRHGFPRAIVLLEQGCTEFSNIHGLVQIRFPRGDILAKSEEIRRVLEREGILPG